MANQQAIDQIARSISFEVEAIPQDNTIQLTSTANTTPLNVKIKVRKKHDAGGAQNAVISIPRLDKPGAAPARVRLVSSDQTIMSFNVFMENEEDQKAERKTKRGFFDFLKAGPRNVDNEKRSKSPTPKKMVGSSSRSVEDMHNDTSLQSANISNNGSHAESKIGKKGILGKCKPGGCLDPPFGEDRYAYAKKKRASPVQSEPVTLYEEDLKIIGAPQEIHKSELYPKQGKDNFDDVISTSKEVNYSSSTHIELHQEEDHNVTATFSNSLITYPPAVTISEQKIYDRVNEKKMKHRPSSAENYYKSSVQSSAEIYYCPSDRKSSTRSNSEKNKQDNQAGAAALVNTLISTGDDKLLTTKTTTKLDISRSVSSSSTLRLEGQPLFPLRSSNQIKDNVKLSVEGLVIQSSTAPVSDGQRYLRSAGEKQEDDHENERDVAPSISKLKEPSIKNGENTDEGRYLYPPTSTAIHAITSEITTNKHTPEGVSLKSSVKNISRRVDESKAIGINENMEKSSVVYKASLLNNTEDDARENVLIGDISSETSVVNNRNENYRPFIDKLTTKRPIALSKSSAETKTNLDDSSKIPTEMTSEVFEKPQRISSAKAHPLHPIASEAAIAKKSMLRSSEKEPSVHENTTKYYTVGDNSATFSDLSLKIKITSDVSKPVASTPNTKNYMISPKISIDRQLKPLASKDILLKLETPLSNIIDRHGVVNPHERFSTTEPDKGKITISNDKETIGSDISAEASPSLRDLQQSKVGTKMAENVNIANDILVESLTKDKPSPYPVTSYIDSNEQANIPFHKNISVHPNILPSKSSSGKPSYYANLSDSNYSATSLQLKTSPSDVSKSIASIPHKENPKILPKVSITEQLEPLARRDVLMKLKSPLSNNADSHGVVDQHKSVLATRPESEKDPTGRDITGEVLPSLRTLQPSKATSDVVENVKMANNTLLERSTKDKLTYPVTSEFGSNKHTNIKFDNITSVDPNMVPLKSSTTKPTYGNLSESIQSGASLKHETSPTDVSKPITSIPSTNFPMISPKISFHKHLEPLASKNVNKELKSPFGNIVDSHGVGGQHERVPTTITEKGNNTIRNDRETIGKCIMGEVLPAIRDVQSSMTCDNENSTKRTIKNDNIVKQILLENSTRDNHSYSVTGEFDANKQANIPFDKNTSVDLHKVPLKSPNIKHTYTNISEPNAKSPAEKTFVSATKSKLPYSGDSQAISNNILGEIPTTTDKKKVSKEVSATIPAKEEMSHRTSANSCSVNDNEALQNYKQQKYTVPTNLSSKSILEHKDDNRKSGIIEPSTPGATFFDYLSEIKSNPANNISTSTKLNTETDVCTNVKIDNGEKALKLSNTSKNSNIDNSKSPLSAIIRKTSIVLSNAMIKDSPAHSNEHEILDTEIITSTDTIKKTPVIRKISKNEVNELISNKIEGDNCVNTVKFSNSFTKTKIDIVDDHEQTAKEPSAETKTISPNITKRQLVNQYDNKTFSNGKAETNVSSQESSNKLSLDKDNGKKDHNTLDNMTADTLTSKVINTKVSTSVEEIPCFIEDSKPVANNTPQIKANVSLGLSKQKRPLIQANDQEVSNVDISATSAIDVISPLTSEKEATNYVTTKEIIRANETLPSVPRLNELSTSRSLEPSTTTAKRRPIHGDQNSIIQTKEVTTPSELTFRALNDQICAASERKSIEPNNHSINHTGHSDIIDTLRNENIPTRDFSYKASASNVRSNIKHNYTNSENYDVTIPPQGNMFSANNSQRIYSEDNAVPHLENAKSHIYSKLSALDTENSEIKPDEITPFTTTTRHRKSSFKLSPKRQSYGANEQKSKDLVAARSHPTNVDDNNCMLPETLTPNSKDTTGEELAVSTKSDPETSTSYNSKIIDKVIYGNKPSSRKLERHITARSGIDAHEIISEALISKQSSQNVPSNELYKSKTSWTSGKPASSFVDSKSNEQPVPISPITNTESNEKILSTSGVSSKLSARNRENSTLLTKEDNTSLIIDSNATSIKFTADERLVKPSPYSNAESTKMEKKSVPSRTSSKRKSSQANENESILDEINFDLIKDENKSQLNTYLKQGPSYAKARDAIQKKLVSLISSKTSAKSKLSQVIDDAKSISDKINLIKNGSDDKHVPKSSKDSRISYADVSKSRTSDLIVKIPQSRELFSFDLSVERTLEGVYDVRDIQTKSSPSLLSREINDLNALTNFEKSMSNEAKKSVQINPTQPTFKTTQLEAETKISPRRDVALSSFDRNNQDIPLTQEVPVSNSNTISVRDSNAISVELTIEGKLIKTSTNDTESYAESTKINVNNISSITSFKFQSDDATDRELLLDKSSYKDGTVKDETIFDAPLSSKKQALSVSDVLGSLNMKQTALNSSKTSTKRELSHADGDIKSISDKTHLTMTDATGEAKDFSKQNNANIMNYSKEDKSLINDMTVKIPRSREGTIFDSSIKTVLETESKVNNHGSRSTPSLPSCKDINSFEMMQTQSNVNSEIDRKEFQHHDTTKKEHQKKLDTLSDSNIRKRAQMDLPGPNLNMNDFKTVQGVSFPKKSTQDLPDPEFGILVKRSTSVASGVHEKKYNASGTEHDVDDSTTTAEKFASIVLDTSKVKDPLHKSSKVPLEIRNSIVNWEISKVISFHDINNSLHQAKARSETGSNISRDSDKGFSGYYENDVNNYESISVKSKSEKGESEPNWKTFIPGKEPQSQENVYGSKLDISDNFEQHLYLNKMLPNQLTSADETRLEMKTTSMAKKPSARDSKLNMQENIFSIPFEKQTTPSGFLQFNGIKHISNSPTKNELTSPTLLYKTNRDLGHSTLSLHEEIPRLDSYSRQGYTVKIAQSQGFSQEAINKSITSIDEPLDSRREYKHSEIHMGSADTRNMLAPRKYNSKLQLTDETGDFSKLELPTDSIKGNLSSYLEKLNDSTIPSPAMEDGNVAISNSNLNMISEDKGVILTFQNKERDSQSSVTTNEMHDINNHGLILKDDAGAYGITAPKNNMSLRSISRKSSIYSNISLKSMEATSDRKISDGLEIKRRNNSTAYVPLSDNNFLKGTNMPNISNMVQSNNFEIHAHEKLAQVEQMWNILDERQSYSLVGTKDDTEELTTLQSQAAAPLANNSRTESDAEEHLNDDGVVVLDLAFQSYLNSRNERVIMSINSIEPPKRYKDDTISNFRSMLRPNDVPIKIQIDSSTDISLGLSRRDLPLRASEEKYDMVSVIKEQTGAETDICADESGPSPTKSANGEYKLQRVLSKVYNGHMIPLQDIIKHLKDDIDALATQQEMFRQKIMVSKKIKSPRISHTVKRCGCLRK